MNKLDIIRAWKDELFRKSLTSDQQALLPEHPAGEMVLSEKEMASINGGILTETQFCITDLAGCSKLCNTVEPCP